MFMLGQEDIEGQDWIGKRRLSGERAWGKFLVAEI